MAQQDVQTMQQAYAAFNRGDIPGVLAAFTNSIEWHEPGGGNAPQGVFHGAQNVAKDVFSKVPAHFAEFSAEPERFIDAGEFVAVVGTYRGRAKAGQTLEKPFVHV